MLLNFSLYDLIKICKKCLDYQLFNKIFPRLPSAWSLPVSKIRGLFFYTTTYFQKNFLECLFEELPRIHKFFLYFTTTHPCAVQGFGKCKLFEQKLRNISPDLFNLSIRALFFDLIITTLLWHWELRKIYWPW